MSRARRIHESERVIAKRQRLAVVTNSQRGPGFSLHRFDRNRPLGHCGNAHCRLCLLDKEMDRLRIKRERRAGHQQEREAS
jgi:hypothetical protein